MTQSLRWRGKFVELIDDIHRNLGYDAPPATYDPDLPLILDLEIEGITFEVVHLRASRPEYFVVECRFGPVPADQKEKVFERLLELNLSLARMHEAAFGIDDETGDVIYSYSESLENVGAEHVIEAMKHVAGQAKLWRQGYFLIERGAMKAPTSYGSFA